MRFGDLLLMHLERRGMSRVEFAQRVGMSDTAVGNVVRGRSAPRYKHAMSWVRALDLSDVEAREFLLEWQLALSPPAVRELVNDLRRELGRRR